MSKLKKVKKIVKKAYKKAPKSKLVGKAATFGVKQILGGPYLDFFGAFYKKGKKKIISYAGSYAYYSFLKSKFAREKINTLPMLIVSGIIRTLFNFLLFSRLITGIRLLDFIISIIITIVITLLAPFFYTSIKAHEDMFLVYTNKFVDNFMGPNGWDYVENVKNQILLMLGIGLIIVLQFIDVNSRYLQEMLVHAMITGFVSDQIQRWIDELSRVRRLHYGITHIESDMNKYENIIPSYKKINICHTDNRVIIGGLKPQKAIIVPQEKLKDYIIVDIDSLIPSPPRFINIIDEYTNSN